MANLLQTTIFIKFSRILVKISQKFVHGGPADNVITCLGNGLMPTMQQTITWTNDGMILWGKYASLSFIQFSRHNSVSGVL